MLSSSQTRLAAGPFRLLPMLLLLMSSSIVPVDAAPSGRERQVTTGPGGRLLTNTGVWTPDGQWLVYDVRSDAAGELFDGARIEAVQVETGEVRVLYESRNGAHCGVATCHPLRREVIFIHGPEHPTKEWSYGPFHRQGAFVSWGTPGTATILDARDLVSPFTPGALRGGSHVHVYSADGALVSFTYEDHVLAVPPADPGLGGPRELNQRNIGVSVIGPPVRVAHPHPRNQDGAAFSVLVTRTVDEPRPGSDEIKKAFEEGWVGTNGYVRADGGRQARALAFQGHVVTARGETIAEVFIVDLPDDLAVAADSLLEGTSTKRPAPPRGVVQRRLTRTDGRGFPGIQGPRHWLRASPDGGQIAFLMKDDAGVPQLWTVSPNGGPPRQCTQNTTGIASAFTWSPDGRSVAHVMDGSVCVTEVATGMTSRLTEKSGEAGAPRPEACVYSPDGRRIAYVRRVPEPGAVHARSNQIFVVAVP